MLMLMLMTTIDYYHSLCLLFLSGGFLKRDTPKSPWVSILKLSIVTKWKLFHVIWNIFQIWETAALFQKYSRFMFRNSRNYEKKPDLKSWKYSRNSSLCRFFLDDNSGYPDKTQTSPSRKSLRRTSWDDGRENAKIFCRCQRFPYPGAPWCWNIYLPSGYGWHSHGIDGP